MSSHETIFYGMEVMTLDDKLRVGIPSRFMPAFRERDASKDDLRVGLIVSPEKCVQVYPWPRYQKMIEKLRAVKGATQQERMLLSVMPGMMDDVTMDKQNRVKITGAMKDLCELDRDVYVVGAMEHVQIFDKKYYDGYLKRQLPDWSAALDLLKLDD